MSESEEVTGSTRAWVLAYCCGGPGDWDHRGQSGSGADLEFGAIGARQEGECEGAGLVHRGLPLHQGTPGFWDCRGRFFLNS